MAEEEDGSDSSGSAGGSAGGGSGDGSGGGSGGGSAEGSAGSGGGTSVSSEMLFEKMLSVVTGVSDSGLETWLNEETIGDAGWIGRTEGGSGHSSWSPNMYFGYYDFEGDKRMWEVISRPSAFSAFDTMLAAVDKNIAKIGHDTMPGLSARLSYVASNLFANFAKVSNTEQNILLTQHTSLSGDESSFKGATAKGLLAQLEAQQKTLESIHKQITDHGGVGNALYLLAASVEHFSDTVTDIWKRYRPKIRARVGAAREAVLLDIAKWVLEGDEAYRDVNREKNHGMSQTALDNVLKAYTWEDRGKIAPTGFVGGSGDLTTDAGYDNLNIAIGQSGKAVLEKAAAEVYTAQNTLEANMRAMLRALDGMVNPVVKPVEVTPTPSETPPGGDGPGDGPDYDKLFEDIFGDDDADGDGGDGDDDADGNGGDGDDDADGNGNGPVDGDGGDGDGEGNNRFNFDPDDIYGDDGGGGAGGNGNGNGNGGAGGDGDGDGDGGEPRAGMTISRFTPGGGGSAGDDDDGTVFTKPGPHDGGSGGAGNGGAFGDGSSQTGGDDGGSAGGGPVGGAGFGGFSGAKGNNPTHTRSVHGDGTDQDGTDVWGTGDPDDEIVTDPPTERGMTIPRDILGPSGEVIPPVESGGGTFGGGDIGVDAGADPGAWGDGGFVTSEDGFTGAGFGGADGNRVGLDSDAWIQGAPGPDDGTGGAVFGGAGGDGAGGGSDIWTDNPADFPAGGDIWGSANADADGGFDFAAGGGGGGSGSGGGSFGDGSSGNPGGGGAFGDAADGTPIGDEVPGGGAGIFGDAGGATGGGSVASGGAGGVPGVGSAAFGGGGGASGGDGLSDPFGISGAEQLHDREGGGGTGGGGMGGMPPMMPPGQQGSGRDRERNTWLAEDSHIWGTTKHLASGVVGLTEDSEAVRPPHIPVGVAAGRAIITGPRGGSTAGETEPGATATGE